MTDESGGFELRGSPDDETRLLAHASLGYVIALPGHPRLVPATTASPKYDAVVQMQDAPFELGFRMDEIPTDFAAKDLLPSLMASYVGSRARTPDRVSLEWVRGRPLPDGASTAMRANYELAGTDPAAMEFLCIVLKNTHKGFHAMHMTLRYRLGDVSPFAWSNVRAALLAHHSWVPTKPPSTNIWPDRSVFVPRSARFELSEAAMKQAVEKAAEIEGLLPGDSDRLATLLLDWTNKPLPPASPRYDELESEVARSIASCLPARAAEVLMRNFHEVESMHDFRGWLWQQFWAVANRAEIQKTN